MEVENAKKFENFSKIEIYTIKTIGHTMYKLCLSKIFQDILIVDFYLEKSQPNSNVYLDMYQSILMLDFDLEKSNSNPKGYLDYFELYPK